MKIKTLKKIVTILFIIFAVFSYFYVKNTLSTRDVEIKEDNDDNEKIIAEKPVKTTVIIDNGNSEQEYELRLENTNTVSEAIDELRKEDIITYEKEAYTYGTEIIELNDKDATEDMRWKVYYNTNESDIKDQIKNLLLDEEEAQKYRETIDNDHDITLVMEDMTVVNNSTIKVVFTRIEEPQ